MNCHINVEFVASIKAIQYLFKYQLKGSDQARISVQADDSHCMDEITVFQNKRYVSSMEASWKILEFPIVEVVPAIVRLPLHLEDQQIIFFNPTTAQHVEDSLLCNQKTMLTAYFQANIDYKEARNYLYHQFPEHFVYKCNEKRWQPYAQPSSTPQSSWTS